MRYARVVWSSAVCASLAMACAHGERNSFDDALSETEPTNQKFLEDGGLRTTEELSSRDATAWLGDSASNVTTDSSTRADAGGTTSPVDAGRGDARVDASGPRVDAGPVDCTPALSCATSSTGGQYLMAGDVAGHMSLRGGYPTFFQFTVSESSGYLIDVGARFKLQSPASTAYEVLVYPMGANTTPICTTPEARGTNVLSTRREASGSQSYTVVVEVRGISGQCGTGEWVLDIDAAPTPR